MSKIITPDKKIISPAESIALLGNSYLNEKQQFGLITDPFEHWSVSARGFGKSQGYLAGTVFKAIYAMPGGVFGLITPTYNKLLQDTLPSLIQGLTWFGLFEGKHFFVEKYAPKNWNWHVPTNAPRTGKFVMHFITGAVIHFVSLNSTASGAGPSYDYFIMDEIKYIKEDVLEHRVLPANRGNLGKWDTHMHHGMIGVTDMPMPDKQWIFDKEQDMNNELISLITQLQLDQNGYIMKLHENKYTESTRKAYENEIRHLEVTLNELRKGFESVDPDNRRSPAVLYTWNSSFDNIHVLGRKYIYDQQRRLPDIVFRMTVLNERVYRPNQPFYDRLSSGVHGYIAKDNGYATDVGLGFNENEHNTCLKDGDHDPSRDLHLYTDYGGNFNCAAVNQVFGLEERFLKNFFRYFPDKIDELCQDIDDYYGCRGDKTIHFHFDHTAKNTNGAGSTYEEAWINGLRKRGWTVIEVYHGRAPSHEDKHLVLNVILAEHEKGLPKFRYNANNCEAMAICLQGAGVYIGKNGFEKDKRDEKNPKIDQATTTHLTDLVDTCLYNAYKRVTQGFSQTQSMLI